MSYFTILHILALIIFFLFFLILVILTFRHYKGRILLFIIFLDLIIATILGGFSMIVLDKYTKKARVENFSHKRVLRTENIIFSGSIRNIGNFSIGSCTLEIKLISNPRTKSDLSGSSMYKPRGGLDFFFNIFGSSDDKENRPLTVSSKFQVGEGIRPNESKKFILTMPYPNYFIRPTIIKKLNCH